MNGIAIVKTGILFSFLFAFVSARSQEEHAARPVSHDPPIPVEMFAGNNQLYYQTTVKKKFSPDSRFSFFSLATFTADYGNKLSENRIITEAQFSYSIAGGFGIMAGTDINSVTGFYPIAGPQHVYASRKILAVTVASFFFNEKKDFKILGIYEFKPPIGHHWALYNRLQFIYNQSLEEGSHNRSYLHLRSGVKTGSLSFGLGANLDRYGPEKIFKDNYGLFVRWEFS